MPKIPHRADFGEPPVGAVVHSLGHAQLNIAGFSCVSTSRMARPALPLPISATKIFDGLNRSIQFLTKYSTAIRKSTGEPRSAGSDRNSTATRLALGTVIVLHCSDHR